MEYFDADVRFPVSSEEMRRLGFAGFASLHELEVGGRETFPPERIVLAASSDAEKLGRAAKNPKVKALLLRTFAADVASVRAAAENRKYFEIPVAPLLETQGVQRAMLMSKMRIFIRLCLKHRAPFFIASQARNALMLRTPQEMIAIGMALGLERDQAAWAVGEAPKALLGKGGNVTMVT